MKKNPSKDLKKQYKKLLELSLIASLVFHIFMFQGFKKFERKNFDLLSKISQLEVEEVPQTQQEKTAPPPARPTVPIPSEDESLPEDETIDDTILDFDEEAPPAPPPPDASQQIVFVPHDEDPAPIGGYAAIKKNLVYPEIALKAGIEGTVKIYAFISEKGEVINTKVMVSLGRNGCDEAAVKAIRSVKWKPAKQRTTPVAVWVMVPVEFVLK